MNYRIGPAGELIFHNPQSLPGGQDLLEKFQDLEKELDQVKERLDRLERGTKDE